MDALEKLGYKKQTDSDFNLVYCKNGFEYIEFRVKHKSYISSCCGECCRGVTRGVTLEENDAIQEVMKDLGWTKKTNLELPCELGSIVYQIGYQTDNYYGTEYLIARQVYFKIEHLKQIGKNVFLTKQEAEKEIEARQIKKILKEKGVI